MRTFLFFLGSTVGSIAFQLTLVLRPDLFQKYGYLVKYVWIVWAAIWLIWLLTHPAVVGRLLGRAANIPTNAISQPSPISVKDSFNPTLNQEANPHFEPHTHIHISPFSDSLKKEDRPRLQRQEPPKTPIIYLGYEVVAVSFGGMFGTEQVSRYTGPYSRKAVVACFRNDVHAMGVRPVDARATGNLILKNKDGREIGQSILGTLWLDDTKVRDSYDLDPGRSGCTVLLIEGNGEWVIPWRCLKTTHFGNYWETEILRLAELPARIEVRLLGHTGLLLPPENIDISKLVL